MTNRTVPAVLLTICSMLSTTVCICAQTGDGKTGKTFYVSPAGNDAWSGTLSEPNEGGDDGPFATPRTALVESRKHQGEPRQITFAEGRFFLTETLALDEHDAGLTLRGAGPRKTVIYGGRELTGWRQTEVSLWVADLPADAPEWSFRVLVVNDVLMDRARLPETGYLEHESDFKVRWMSTAGGGWERKPTAEELTAMTYKAGDIPASLNVRNAEVTVCHMWDESTVPVAAHDPANRTLTFATP